MKISTLLNVGLTSWEESLISVVLLQGREVPIGTLNPVVEERMRTALLKLTTLPTDWAKEICFQVLTDAK